jgi:hypothetical protein
VDAECHVDGVLPECLLPVTAVVAEHQDLAAVGVAAGDHGLDPGDALDHVVTADVLSGLPRQIEHLAVDYRASGRRQAPGERSTPLRDPFEPAMDDEPPHRGRSIQGHGPAGYGPLQPVTASNTRAMANCHCRWCR